MESGGREESLTLETTLFYYSTQPYNGVRVVANAQKKISVSLNSLYMITLLKITIKKYIKGSL